MSYPETDIFSFDDLVPKFHSRPAQAQNNFPTLSLAISVTIMNQQ